ncbi:hypothetical protein OKW21_000673 [Catalinimonas alkaloidigena]|nr:hypothetical protein [Catalinimonas alkaloidigena]
MWNIHNGVLVFGITPPKAAYSLSGITLRSDKKIETTPIGAASKVYQKVKRKQA